MEAETFGRRLRRTRKARGFRTCRDLENASGIHRSSISSYENGLTYPGMLKLKTLGEALSVTVSYLLEGDVTLEKDTDRVFIRRYLQLSHSDRENVRLTLDLWTGEKDDT